MPALNPLLALDVSTRARADAFAPEFDVSTRSVRSTSDALALTLTITRELAAALESSVRVIGVQIDIDKGDGVLVPLIQTEIDGNVTLRASRDGYGSRTLSFTLQVPPSQSPFYTAWARGPHRVRMTGYLGLPGAMQPRPMFVGQVAQCSWEAYPSLLRVDCQDVSALVASEMLAYNLEPGSLRTRKSVFREIFAPYLVLYGVEFGQLDFGPDDGGVLFKGISEGGTVGLLQWAAAFLAPIGRRLNWGDGACNVEPSYASGPVIRTFRANDIANLSVSLPGAADPNAVVMSGTVFSYHGPSGHRTEIDPPVITSAVFAPATAVRRQDHVTGAIEELSLTIEPVEQEVARMNTTRGYDAGTLISTSVQEWAWYSARACPNEQLDDGSVTFNHAFDVYQYADGTWRLDSQQQYQMVRTTNTFRHFDGVLREESTLTIKIAPSIVPIGYVDAAGVASHFPVFLTVDGVGWFAGCEFFFRGDSPDERLIADGLGPETLASNGRRLQSNRGSGWVNRNLFYFGDVDGNLLSTLSRTVTWGNGHVPVLAPVIGEDAYIFGPGMRYGRSDFSFGFLPLEPTIATVFTAIDETSHRETETVSGNPFFDIDGIPPAVVAKDHVVAGAIPKLEQPTSGQTAQPASVTVIDSVREALLGKQVDDHQQNDFCETVDELGACALELLRDKAPAVEFDALMDWTVATGKAIAILLPDVIPAGEVMTAWDIEWTLNGMTGENKQHVIARWLPQELR